MRASQFLVARNKCNISYLRAHGLLNADFSHNMDGERHGPRGLFGGCNSIGQKIFARASSSESLEEGPRATRLAWTPVPAGATGPRKRFPKLTSPGGLFNRYKQYRNRDKGKDPGMNTVRGVLIPVMENMWGEDTVCHVFPVDNYS